MKQENQNTVDNQLAVVSSYPLLFDSLEKKVSKMDIIRCYNSLTLKKVIEQQFPTIGSLQKEHGIEKIEKFTGVLIMDLSLSFEKDLKEPQIEELTVEINNSILRNLSLEGLFVAFQELKKSNVIGKLSISKVLKHLNTFFEEQSTMIMNNNFNQHLSNKFNGNSLAEIENKRIKKGMHEVELQMLERKINKNRKTQ